VVQLYQYYEEGNHVVQILVMFFTFLRHIMWYIYTPAETVVSQSNSQLPTKYSDLPLPQFCPNASNAYDGPIL
jgi:hypothetical protein